MKLKLRDFITCPICGGERHRVHEIPTQSNRIILACNQGHRFAVTWETS